MIRNPIGTPVAKGVGMYHLVKNNGVGGAAKAVWGGVVQQFTDVSTPRAFGHTTVNWLALLPAPEAAGAGFAGEASEASGTLSRLCREGGSCFVAGTLVWMADGSTKPVEQVHSGDWVLSRDPVTGKVSASQVGQCSERQAGSVIAVTLSDAATGQSQTLVCSPEHPFSVDGRGFVAAASLGIGTQIVTRAGPSLTVTAVETLPQDGNNLHALDTAFYDAFGKQGADIDASNPVGTVRPIARAESIGFGGQRGYYTDSESGLLNLTHRYYDPGTGRFLTRDPIGYKGGINLYGYAGNNPVNDSDLRDLDPTDKRLFRQKSLGRERQGRKSSTILSIFMKQPPWTLLLDVRDYECDLQGIVNNAVYQNYLEHARHVFLRSAGIDFAALSREGVNLVVTRAELDYLLPLRSGDSFAVSVAMERISRLRFGFRQEIIRLSDSKPILRALVIGTALGADGRPGRFPQLETLLTSWPTPTDSAVSEPKE